MKFPLVNLISKKFPKFIPRTHLYLIICVKHSTLQNSFYVKNFIMFFKFIFLVVLTVFNSTGKDNFQDKSWRRKWC